MAKAIEMFLVDGSASGIITTDIFGWKGRAIKMSRNDIGVQNSVNIARIGVYFLFCDKDDGSRSVYIGESGDVQKRLLQHIQDYNADKEKFYWDSAVILLSEEFDKSITLYLEDYFAQRAMDCNRFALETQKTCGNVSISDTRKAVMKDFIDNATLLINVLGDNILAPLVQPSSNGDGTTSEGLLYINRSGTDAKCKMTSEGFVVLKGSVIRGDTADACPQKIRAKREDKALVDENLITKMDILFKTPSSAAEFVLGSTASGNNEWHTNDGKSLGNLMCATENTEGR